MFAYTRRTSFSPETFAKRFVVFDVRKYLCYCVYKYPHKRTVYHRKCDWTCPERDRTDQTKTIIIEYNFKYESTVYFETKRNWIESISTNSEALIRTFSNHMASSNWIFFLNRLSCTSLFENNLYVITNTI